MLEKLAVYLIGKSNANKIDEILNAAMRRKESFFPDWEICYLALPRKDREQRRKTLETMLEIENGSKDVQESTPSIPKY